DLDVMYTPRPGDPADLGTRVFGSDPFWVGELGTAYIRGLHEGSEGQLLVSPRHLPGLGSADRPLEEEVPTVQKPLEQLKQIELVPFFAAAKASPGTDEAADAFLVTHIRYRGFQGVNIRRTTRPISLDATALQSVTSLDEVAPWRGAGGVLIADNLGLPSVHRSYDPSGLSFNARRVTQDALSAGNDLLILDRFGSPDNWSVHFANVRDTLRFLASLYRDQPAFASLVDNAVYRILAMKMRIYPEFDLSSVERDPESATEVLGAGAGVAADVARQGLTLIYPVTEELLPSPPQEGESIVVFTQERRIAIAEDIEPLVLLEEDEIADTMQRFYGPQGTGVLRFNAVRAFTFQDLTLAMETGVPVASEEEEGEEEETTPTIATQVYNALENANWIVFATTGLDAKNPGTMALKSFLASEANLLEAQIAVFAFGPPYELDSTEIAKLSVYYGLFSTGTPFVDAAVRALFQTVVAHGDSPVDIPAMEYFIPNQTMPDAEQTISLSVVDEDGEELTAEDRTNIHVGDLLFLRTGVIKDGNDRIVPDGTPVQFVLNYPQEGGSRTLVAETVDGVAATEVTLDRVGQLDVTARSEPAVSSVRLELTIRDDGITITEVPPTSTPEPTPTLTPTMTPEPTATAIPLPPTKEIQLPNPAHLPTPDRNALIRWGLLGALVTLGLGFLWSRQLSMSAQLAATVALTATIGSLSGYILLMVLARWWLPAVRYVLVGREYLAAPADFLAGGVVLGITLWVTRDRAEAKFNPRPSRLGSEHYLRSRP
ncbi:MAG: glycoside hydrolase family 3 N-terminal domain-containing protein, partial [Anaerolineae bacterium]